MEPRTWPLTTIEPCYPGWKPKALWKTLNLGTLWTCRIDALLRIICVWRLSCMALVLLLLMNQTPLQVWTLMLGTLNPGNLEPQNPGNLGLWNLGILKPATVQSYPGILQRLGSLPGSVATLERWSLLLGAPSCGWPVVTIVVQRAACTWEQTNDNTWQPQSTPNRSNKNMKNLGMNSKKMRNVEDKPLKQVRTWKTGIKNLTFSQERQDKAAAVAARARLVPASWTDELLPWRILNTSKVRGDFMGRILWWLTGI